MMNEDDRTYFTRRAEESRMKAEAAPAPFLAVAYRKFAETYEQKLANLETRRVMRRSGGRTA